MKVKRKIISVLLSLLIFTQIFSTCKLNTLATSGVNTFSTENIGGYNCYVYSNPSALPNSFSVYWVYGGKVCTAPATKWLIAALNKKLGTTFTDNWFTDFNTYFMTQIMSVSSLAGDFFTGGATRVSNGSNIVGVAFNDLTGLTLENDIPSNATITTPSNCINVTYNILNNYLEDNPSTPPYVIVKIYNKDSAQSALGNATDNSQWTVDYNLINQLTSGNNTLISIGNRSGKSYWELFNSRGSVGTYDLTDKILSLSTSDYNSLVNGFSLTDTNFTIELTDLLAYTGNIYPTVYNKDGTSTTISQKIYNDSGTLTNTVDNFTAFYIHQYFRSNSDPYHLTAINADGQVTIYQSNSIPLQIQNNTYNQNFYTSTNYKNYDNTSNNSFNMSYQNVNNSQLTNQTIYNETKTTTNQNIENNNYNIDQSVNDNSTTTIINNYYGDSGGGGGDDPSPDPDPDDDDSIWKALLKAIGEFFEKIGELLATILTGIVTLFTDILGAITEITTGFTAITDFLGSVFSWLPTEIIAILTLGLSLGVFICLIKLFK